MVNNVENPKIVGRYRYKRGLSPQQAEILDVLSRYPRVPRVEADGSVFMGHLARTSEIVDALGGNRTPARYASISRALARLVDRGHVTAYRGGLYSAGKGFRYALRKTNGDGPR